MNVVARAQLPFQMLILLQKIDSLMVKQQTIIGLSIIGTYPNNGNNGHLRPNDLMKICLSYQISFTVFCGVTLKNAEPPSMLKFN